MSTRSRIGIEDPETGKIRSVYCHSDGYLSHNGQMLVDHYKDRAKVEELIALGNLSFIDERLAPKGPHHFDYDKREAGVTVAYHRDRGEELEIAEDVDADAYIARATDGWEEFAYLYRQGVWFVREIGGDAGPFMTNANDPEGDQQKPWLNVEGALRFGMEDHRAYAIGGNRVPFEL